MLARLKDLLSVEQEVLSLKSKCKGLEGELTDCREWVLDVEAERKILEELHHDDDQHIEDLSKHQKDMEVRLKALESENKQLTIQQQDLQKEIFQLHNKMESRDLSAAQDFGSNNLTPFRYQPASRDADCGRAWA